MGIILGLETSTGQEPPMWFSRTDSKKLVHHLANLRWKTKSNELVKLQGHLDVDLEPLSRLAGEEEPLDSYLARDPTPEREESWHRTHEEYKAAWQDPLLIISRIEELLNCLNTHQDSWSTLEIEDNYFTSGFFEQDMRDLLGMASWARDQGIPKVRLMIG